MYITYDCLGCDVVGTFFDRQLGDDEYNAAGQGLIRGIGQERPCVGMSGIAPVVDPTIREPDGGKSGQQDRRVQQYEGVQRRIDTKVDVRHTYQPLLFDPAGLIRQQRPGALRHGQQRR